MSFCALKHVIFCIGGSAQAGLCANYLRLNYQRDKLLYLFLFRQVYSKKQGSKDLHIYNIFYFKILIFLETLSVFQVADDWMVHHRDLSKSCPDVDLVEANHVLQAERVVDHERGDGRESLEGLQNCNVKICLPVKHRRAFQSDDEGRECRSTLCGTRK